MSRSQVGVLGGFYKSLACMRCAEQDCRLCVWQRPGSQLRGELRLASSACSARMVVVWQACGGYFQANLLRITLIHCSRPNTPAPAPSPAGQGDQRQHPDCGPAKRVVRMDRRQLRRRPLSAGACFGGLLCVVLYMFYLLICCHSCRGQVQRAVMGSPAQLARCQPTGLHPGR